jgi:hypothetical protein
MGLFLPTGVSLSSERKHNSEYLEFRPYCAIAAPTLLPQKQRDAFLAQIGMQTKSGSPSESVHSLDYRIRILGVALAVLAFLLIVLGVLWRLHFL